MSDQQTDVCISHADLLRLLSYDPVTGAFRWRVSPCNNVAVGREAGTLKRNGYRVIRLLGREYLAHRFALFFVTREWPPVGTDHINGVRSDNSIANLRLATQSENTCNRGPQYNNRSGTKGVCWVTLHGHWRAHICVRGQKMNLGAFQRIEDAAAARREAEEKYQGEFAWRERPL
jgi:hypothetical protein